jgi:hypothetical protein
MVTFRLRRRASLNGKTLTLSDGVQIDFTTGFARVCILA